MPRTKAIEEIAGLMKGLRSARQQSPFFTMVIRDEWLVSFDYAIVIHSIHSMLKNSIHSIQKLMNVPSAYRTSACNLNSYYSWDCAWAGVLMRAKYRNVAPFVGCSLCRNYSAHRFFRSLRQPVIKCILVGNLFQGLPHNALHFPCIAHICNM